MAFDPNTYVPPKSEPQAAGFDPDAYLAKNKIQVAPEAPPPAPEESRLDKFLSAIGFKGNDWFPDPAKKSPAEIQAGLNADKLTLDAGPFADDWIAQNIVTGLPAAGIGKVVGIGTRALAPAAPKVAARVAAGAAEGATASKLQGGDALPGAAIGAAIPFFGSAYRAAKNAVGQAAVRQEGTDLLSGVVRGDGSKGAATTTAAKLVERQKAPILDTLRADDELAKMSRKPAAEALPVVHERMDKVGSQLDPNYDVIDAVTGGVRVGDLARALDAKAAEYAKTPLNEQYIAAVNDIKDSALKAWGNVGVVPTREVRALVTRLQKRGTQVINSLNPGESSQMKADMASLMKEFIDQKLDMAAAQHPGFVGHAVEQIRDLNKQYSALATMANAVEQRGWKESTGAKSMGGHVEDAAKKGGLVAATAMAMSGNIPGAVASLGAPYALKAAGSAAQGAVRGLARSHRAAQGAVEAPGLVSPIVSAREAQREREAARAAAMGSR